MTRAVRAALLAAALALPAPAGADEIAAITSQNADRVTLLDAATLALRSETPLPGKPAAVALDGPRGRVLVVAVDTRRLHVLDARGVERASHPLPGAPFGIAVDPATGQALVTDWEGRLLVVDPVSGAVVKTIATGAVPSGVAVTPDGRLAVTADRDANAVSLIDLTTGEVTARVPVGAHPFGVTLEGGRAFTADVLADTVSVVDLATARVVATLPTGERPYAVAFAAGRGFVTNQYGATLTVFDATTLEPLGEVAVGEYPEGVAVTAEGKLLVANWFDDTVSVVDPVTLEVTDTLDMPSGPRAFGSFVARMADQPEGFAALPGQ